MTFRAVLTASQKNKLNGAMVSNFFKDYHVLMKINKVKFAVRIKLNRIFKKVIYNEY